MNVYELFEKYGDEKSCLLVLEQKRWPEGIACPYCDCTTVYRRRNFKRFKCKECNRSFTALTGTIFHASKIPISKWFIAIATILHAKKGISALQLARTINVNKDTAWYMQMRLRRAMKQDLILKGLIEVDETYVGGSLSNKHYFKKKKLNYDKTGMAHKTPVLGMKQRDGCIVVQVVEHASGQFIQPLIHKHINPESRLITDGHGAYYGIGESFNKHIRINKSKFQRSWGRYHTNTLEGFWALLKRSIIGQFHKITREHLQSYLDELCFKYNNRQNDPFEALIHRCVAS